jgi:ABC-type branched-subunit amino acid transport system ATPase component
MMTGPTIQELRRARRVLWASQALEEASEAMDRAFTLLGEVGHSRTTAVRAESVALGILRREMATEVAAAVEIVARAAHIAGVP